MKDKVRDWVKKVYGPYIRKDGRKHIILYDGTRRQTVSYPKWLMEQYLGRVLTDDETVDHIDRDFTNNNLDNLRILDRKNHASIDVIRVKLVEIVCVRCGDRSLKKGNYLHGNAKQGKAGPFCGRSCAGKYGAEVKNSRKNKREPQNKVDIKNREYYLKDK